MSIDLTKPIRLKGSRELRKYGGPFGSGHVVLNADDTFATTTPISMAVIEAEYENPPEDVNPEYVIVDAPIGLCGDDETSRYALAAVMTVPADDGVCLFATNGRMLAAVEAAGSVRERRYIPISLLQPKPGDTVRVDRIEGKWTQGCGGIGGEVELYSPRYPNITPILADRSQCVAITIDARLLLKMAKAMGGEGEECRTSITLLVSQTDEENGVACMGQNGVGVLMCRGGVNGGGPERHERTLQRYNERAKKFRSVLA